MTKKIILIESFKDGQKAAEIDITDFDISEIKEAIWLQEYQGRTWSYKTIKQEEGER